MTVQSNFTAPAQPTTGTLEYIPLGGNGLTAPKAAYSVVGHLVDGNVSSGAMQIRMTMDPRYCSLVSWVTFQIIQATAADADVRVVIGDVDLRVPKLIQQGPVVKTATLVNVNTVAGTFTPTPVILPGGGVLPFIQVAALNVDGDSLSFDALVYLFRIDVREKTPMGPLLWARGAT